MSLYLIVVVQFLLPLVFAIDLAFVRRPSRAIWGLQVGSVVVWTLFLLMIGRWDGPSYYWLAAIPFLLMVAAFRGYRRITPGAGPAKRLNTAINAVFFLGFLAADGYIVAAYFPPAGAVEMSFPLAGGVYYVGGGGDSRFINGHQGSKPQRFALDIVQLNAAGRTSGGLFSNDLQGFAIFGQTVLSPCDGTVVVAEDGHPDLIPPDCDLNRVAGNHVVIACSGIKVMLAHLRQGSVSATVGQLVLSGTPLGQVGNSGNATQPHLHIHAERGGPETSIMENEPVPFTLDGRFAVRNSLFFR